MIVLQNLITTNHRRSAKSKYDRKQTELNVVTKGIQQRVNSILIMNLLIVFISIYFILSLYHKQKLIFHHVSNTWIDFVSR